MPSWTHTNAAVLAHLPAHIAELQRLVRQSLIVGYNVGLITFDESRNLFPGEGVTPASLGETAKYSVEVPDIFKRSHFLGRWLSTAGNTPTVFSVLGIGFRHATS
jgi:hypothetical protein